MEWSQATPQGRRSEYVHNPVSVGNLLAAFGVREIEPGLTVPGDLKSSILKGFSRIW